MTFPLAVLLAIGLLAAQSPRAAAQNVDSGRISREHSIKAAFLYNFGRYVAWPPEAFRDARDPFVIGVLGPSPVTPDLRRIAETKKIQDRPIRIRQLADEEEVRGCHILFVPAALEREIRTQAIRQCSKQPVLLAGEDLEFLKEGGMIDLVVEQNKVLVYIALKAAQREGLTISSKLLQVARIVD